MEGNGSSRTPLSTPPWWAYPLLLPGPLLAWHDVIAHELARVPGAPGGFASPALAWAGVAVLAAGLLAETAFYGILWAARGRRLPFRASALVLLQLSMLEALASGILQWAPATGPGFAAGWVLAGPRLAWAGGAPGGFLSAFGSCGVLTFVRIALWAWAQAEGVGRRWREAAVTVGTVWLATHVAQGWLMELLRGRSMPS